MRPVLMMRTLIVLCLLAVPNAIAADPAVTAACGFTVWGNAQVLFTVAWAGASTDTAIEFYVYKVNGNGAAYGAGHAWVNETRSGSSGQMVIPSEFADHLGGAYYAMVNATNDVGSTRWVGSAVCA